MAVYYSLPKCPNCGFEDQDWWDGLCHKHDGDSWETYCADCGEELRITISVSPSFNTENIGTHLKGDTMDTGEGRFEHFTNIKQVPDLKNKYPKAKGIFTVGEQLEIRGSFFEVKDISPFGIKLKLLRQP